MTKLWDSAVFLVYVGFTLTLLRLSGAFHNGFAPWLLEIREEFLDGLFRHSELAELQQALLTDLSFLYSLAD
jgi:hypothetical protein